MSSKMKENFLIGADILSGSQKVFCVFRCLMKLKNFVFS